MANARDLGDFEIARAAKFARRRGAMEAVLGQQDLLQQIITCTSLPLRTICASEDQTLLIKKNFLIIQLLDGATQFLLHHRDA